MESIATDGGSNRSEIRLNGSRVSAGWGTGKAWIPPDLLRPNWKERSIESREVDRELERILVAFRETRHDVDESARRIEEQFSTSLAGIFHAHAMMLDGLLSSGEFETELRESLIDAESAVRRVFRRWYQKFQALKDVAFQQRADDVIDLGRKILRHLDGEDGSRMQNLPAGSVLVARLLLPSDVVSLVRDNVAAVVVERLGQGSHAALLAREKSIPTVAEFPDLLDQIHDGDELLVDAFQGIIVISPTAATKAEFRERLGKQSATVARCRGTCQQPAYTRDGQLVKVEGNIGGHQDAELALDNGADGVGLFRIEQIYLARELPPTDVELLEELRVSTAPLRDKSITIRLLDIGGDKPVSFLRFPAATNPALGSRGVRLLLEYSQLARTQLAALLRLSQEQQIQVLVPMVTLEDDIRAMRLLFDVMIAELGIRERPLFGAMIETPAAALGVAAIARHVDFLCVGTNDLTQYTLAAGRDDPAVNRYYLQDHASILRLLDIIAADAGKMPITICGELASKEEIIPHLLRAGFRALSMAPALIPAVKEFIRSMRIQPAA